MSKSKYLIIGGSGFVGSFLIKELHNYKVGNLDKNSGNISAKGKIYHYSNE